MNVRMLPLKFCYYVLLTVAVAPVNMLLHHMRSIPSASGEGGEGRSTQGSSRAGATSAYIHSYIPSCTPLTPLRPTSLTPPLRPLTPRKPHGRAGNGARAQARAALRDRAATLTTLASSIRSSKATTPSASHAPSPPAQRPHQRAAAVTKAVTPSEKLRRWRRDEDQVEVQ